MATHITNPGSFGSEFADHDHHHANEAQRSGVSWGAVIGGAFVAAATYLLLLAAGAGLGLSAISPWSSTSAKTLGAVAIAWLIVAEIISSGLGGYLTGRLRTKWAVIHTDEVYFRDTANGFLAWTVAFVISATFMASAAASMAGSADSIVTSPVTDPNAYFVDTLFRTDRIAPESRNLTLEAEAGRVLTHGLATDFPAADQAYLARMTAAQTGISYPEAERRVSDVIAQAKQAADTARKVTARLLLWTCLALLLGALSASYAATIGGRQRDHVRMA